MRDYTPKVSEQAVDLLAPGEAIFRSVIGNPEGSFLAAVNRGKTVQAATVAASREREPTEGLAARIPQKSGYVTLTDRRLLVFGTTRMGKVDRILAEFRLDEVAALRSEKAGFKKHQLTMEFVDGSAFRFLIIQNQQPDDLVEEFSRLTS